jgi:hypothetical protein
MAQTLYQLFREIRPRQWVKNLTLFAAAFFTGKFLDLPILWTSFIAFIVFCLVSSSLYIVNDLVDLEKDRLHPFKKNRPLASGKLNPKVAKVFLFIAVSIAFAIATQISWPFFLLVLVFFLMQLAYSFYLKNITLLDILTIASGFILRVFAGEVATGYHIDIWLFLTVVSAALFIATGKRRSELTLLSGWQGTIPARTRATLSRYSERMLDVYISMFANSTWLTYAFYTFLRQPPILRQRIGDLFDQYNLAVLLQERKWLMITVPLVIYGIMRYLQLIYEKNEGESPEKVLLSDRPLIFAITLCGLIVFGVIYIIGK